MKTRLITYLSVLGILLLLLLQAYILHDNYNQTRAFLTRESSAVLESAFRKELSIRVKTYKHLIREDDIVAPPPTSSKKDTATVDMRKMNNIADNALGAIDLAINHLVSSLVPLNVNRLDAVTGPILLSRNIRSTYIVRILDSKSDKVLEHSDKKFRASIFTIPSKPLLVDFQRNKSLQLVLINPFSNIFKRMGTVLISSLLLALFGMYGIWFLFQTQARQKKLMAVKNDFFGNTAHELKRPVTQLYMALEALSTPTVDGNKERKERYLAISREATKDMSEKITMIMTLAMDEEGVFRLNYSQFNLAEEVEKLKEQFSTVSDKKVSIEIENTVDDANIKADRDHLRQCIANLIDNAIKYSGASVLISISIRRIKNSLCVSVKDNGIGIKPEKVERVFTKYTRLNTESGSPAGFGIGLSYVKTVVEKHAGRIEVKSEIEKGSEFIVYLPFGRQ